MHASMFTFHIVLLSALSSIAAATCTLQNLQDAASAYISSVAAGVPSATIAKASYKENNKAANITAGLLSTPMKIDHNKTLFDTTLCGTYTELIIADPKAPYVIGTQIHLGGDGTIALVDTIWTSTGDWLFK